MNNSEAHTKLVHDVLYALGREKDFRLFKMQPGGQKDQFGKPVRCGPVGMADLCGILHPHGRWVCLEAKTGTGRQSIEQKNWMLLIRSMGGFYAVIRSVEEAKAALDRARKGDLS